MKRKVLVAVLAVVLVAGTLAAPIAQIFAADMDSEKESLTGTWYGSSMGIPMTLEIEDSGDYRISIDDQNKEKGVWTLEDNNFIMDKDTDYEMEMQFDGDSISLEDDDLIKFHFTREKENEEKEQEKDAAKESDFIGVWHAGETKFETLSADTPEAFGLSDVFADVKDGKINLYITGSGISSPIDLEDIETSFSDGVLSFDIEEDETSDNAVVTIRTGLGQETPLADPDNHGELFFTESGQLKMRIVIDGKAVVFDMEKSTKKELEKAKSSKNTVVLTSDTEETENDTSGKPTVESVDEYLED